MKRKIFCSCWLLIYVLLVGPALAQRVPEQEFEKTTPSAATGISPMGTYSFGSIDSISLQNGNLCLNIPLLSLDGRGIDLGISLIYNSKTWFVKELRNGYLLWRPRGMMNDGLALGWQLSIPKMKYETVWTDYDVTYTLHTLTEGGAGHCFTNELKLDRQGRFRNLISTGYSYDSTYMIFKIPNSSTTNYVVKRDGTVLFFGGLYGRPTVYPQKIKDRNGNYLTIILRSEAGYTNGGHLIHAIEDTLGRRIDFKYEGDMCQLSSIDYTDVNGTVRSTQFQYAQGRLDWDHKDWGGVADYHKDITVLDKVILPNGLYYDFDYDSALNQGRGQVTSVTLPTGGKFKYTYGKSEFPGDSWDYDVVVKKEEIEGQTTYQWQYQYVTSALFPKLGSYPLTTTVIDPLGNHSKYVFTNVTYEGELLEASREVYSGEPGTGMLLRKHVTNYDFADTFRDDVSQAVWRPQNCANPRPIREITYLYDTTPPQGYTKSMTYNIILNGSRRYCPDGNPISTDEFRFSGDVYIPENSIKLRTTKAEYLHTTNRNYFGFNLLDLLTKQTVLDSSGNNVSETRIDYDSFSVPSNTTVHYEAPLNGTCRGNPTRKTVELFSGTDIITEQYFDIFGNVTKSKDGNGNETNYSYTSSYCYAYPETITDAKGHATTSTYSFHTGNRLSSTDPNGNRSDFTFDLMGRLVQTSRPDGGGTSYVYNDAIPISIMTNTKLTSSQSLVSYTFYDGFGRPVSTRKVDPEGDVLTETSYNAQGITASQSAPHRSGEGAPMTNFQYDALGRTTKTIYPDGNDTDCVYAGYLSKIFDPTGRWREYQYDPLGNLVAVNDGGIYTVNYQYSVNGSLLGVTQGDRVRTFVYDAANRVTFGNNPETGSATFSYDLCSNLIGKTDANSVQTTLGYDSLNRVVSTAYSDSTPSITYYYDGANPLAIACQNPKGHLTGVSMPRIKEAFSYDKMGRLVKEVKEIDGQRFEIAYVYDLAGNLISEVYPSGRVVSAEVNAAGKITRLRDETRYRDVINNINYAAFGSVRQKVYGNGLVNSVYFNSRMQPVRIQHGNALDLSYQFYDSMGGNNGDVISITDNIHAEKSSTYSYDALSRLVSAASTAWSQLFSYDQYGNMLAKQGLGGAPSASFSYNQKNQIVGLTFDNNGNLTSDGLIALNYDANNQVRATGIYSYLYDSDGNRIIKEKNSNPVETSYYIYDLSGMPIAEYVKVGGGPVCWKKDLVYLGTSLVQTAENPNPQSFSLPPLDLVQYYHHDHLGNVRALTDYVGTLTETHDFYPFGEEIQGQPQSQDKYLFTGKQRDAESGLDYFGNRYYGSAIGRFLSPDPGKPDVKIPQSWNKYGYCLSNPEKYVDPAGKYFVVPKDDPNRYRILRTLAQGALTKSGGEVFRRIQNDPRPCLVRTGRLPADAQKAVCGRTHILPGARGAVVILDFNNIDRYRNGVWTSYHELKHVDTGSQNYPYGVGEAKKQDDNYPNSIAEEFGKTVSDEADSNTDPDLRVDEWSIVSEIETTQDDMSQEDNYLMFMQIVNGMKELANQFHEWVMMEIRTDHRRGSGRI